MLRRFLQLREETEGCLEDRNSGFCVCFESAELIQMAVFFADMLHYLIALNYREKE